MGPAQHSSWAKPSTKTKALCGLPLKFSYLSEKQNLQSLIFFVLVLWWCFQGVTSLPDLRTALLLIQKRCTRTYQPSVVTSVPPHLLACAPPRSLSLLARSIPSPWSPPACPILAPPRLLPVRRPRRCSRPSNHPDNRPTRAVTLHPFVAPPPAPACARRRPIPAAGTPRCHHHSRQRTVVGVIRLFPMQRFTLQFPRPG